jgi:hypothetical protein
MVNQHFSSFNNLEQHLELETSKSYSLFFSTPSIMSSTPSVSSDVDLLWCENESEVYFKLFDFKNSLQVYVEANHLDDDANAKPSNDASVVDVEVSNATYNEVGDDFAILFS